jgi:hypothetical protein
MIKDPEKTSHHLKLDHDNEYIRFKTRANKGATADQPANPSGVGQSEINQGIEARDGTKGDGPWAELVDCQHRGMWFSKQSQLGIWRAKKGRQMYTWMDDINKKIVIYNNEAAGTIEIYANRRVNVITNDSINLRADKHIFIKAGGSIRMQAGGAKLTLFGSNLVTNADYYGARLNAYVCGVFPGPGAGCPNPGGASIQRIQRPQLPSSTEPQDRAKTYNKPYEEAEEIK